MSNETKNYRYTSERAYDVDISALFDKEAESAVCGAICLETSAIYEVADILSADMFGDPMCARIFSAATAIFERGEKCDMITVSNEMKVQGMEQDDAFRAVAEITGIVSSSANIVQHALYVRECYTRRSFYYSAQGFIQSVTDKTTDVDSILEVAGKTIDDLLSVSAMSDNTSTLADCIPRVYDRYTNRRISASKGETVGITTGLSRLDKATGGWNGGELIVLAARPGIGKTAMMLHFARSAAEKGIPVVIFNLEMSDISLTERLVLGLSDVNSERFKTGTLYKEEEAAMYDAGSRLMELPITINDTAQMSMRQIKTVALRLKRQGRCGIIFIDYLQLVDMRTGERNRTRENEVTAASRMAKIIAKDLDVPVVLLSQLNREADGQRPMLSHLRESGAIEQDADEVMFIYRKQDESQRGEIILAKHRNGVVGSFEFGYNDSMTRIYDIKNTVPLPTTNDLPFERYEDEVKF